MISNLNVVSDLRKCAETQAMTVLSPCINICQIDSESQLCLGCKRNVEEITNWLNMSDSEKLIVLGKVKERYSYNIDSYN